MLNKNEKKCTVLCISSIHKEEFTFWKEEKMYGKLKCKISICIYIPVLMMKDFPLGNTYVLVMSMHLCTQLKLAMLISIS